MIEVSVNLVGMPNPIKAGSRPTKRIISANRSFFQIVDEQAPYIIFQGPPDAASAGEWSGLEPDTYVEDPDGSILFSHPENGRIRRRLRDFGIPKQVWENLNDTQRNIVLGTIRLTDQALNQALLGFVLPESAGVRASSHAFLRGLVRYIVDDNKAPQGVREEVRIAEQHARGRKVLLSVGKVLNRIKKTASKAKYPTYADPNWRAKAVEQVDRVLGASLCKGSDIEDLRGGKPGIIAATVVARKVNISADLLRFTELRDRSTHQCKSCKSILKCQTCAVETSGRQSAPKLPTE